MDDPALLLSAYDEQLRTTAETVGATTVSRLGPLWLVTFPGGRGFVTYRDLGGATADGVRRLVGAALHQLGTDATITQVEWKTRGHDVAPGLDAALAEHGFVADEPESIMVGRASALAVDVTVPAGVTLRRVTAAADVRAACALQAEVFGDPFSTVRADGLLDRLSRDDGVELWVAEAGGAMIGAGRLEPVAGTGYAGIWGGATRPGWRGRGVYRALTAARARSALRRGTTMINSDSTAFSRPILERAGLVMVSTTTPFHWRR